MGTNSVAIVGRLAKDPTCKGDDDNPRLHFTVAVDNGKDRNGDDREPDWIQVVVFGSYGQAIAQVADRLDVNLSELVTDALILRYDITRDAAS
jgi:single-stranded DNA-binding protein